MKRIVLCLIGAFLALTTRSAAADRYDFHRGFELQVGGSLGGSIIEVVDPSESSTSKRFALNAVARIRHPRTPFGFEQTLILPHGTMSAMLLDAWRADRWRAHLDLGAFIPIGGRHMSAISVERSWDVVLGLGAEALVYKRLSVTVDWRVFLPDPTTIPQRYGDFVRPVYKEAQRGGQLWLGANWVF